MIVILCWIDPFQLLMVLVDLINNQEKVPFKLLYVSIRMINVRLWSDYL